MSIQYFPSGGCAPSSKGLPQTSALLPLMYFLRRRIDALRKYLELRKAWRINRQAFQNMLYLNDRILEDIGVTRADVLWANRLPLRENAALELRKISQMKCHAAHRPSSRNFQP